MFANVFCLFVYFPAHPSGRDRFRTMVNVMGDALATGIMAHICRKDFMKEGDGVSGWLADDAMTQKETIIVYINPPQVLRTGFNNASLFLSLEMLTFFPLNTSVEDDILPVAGIIQRLSSSVFFPVHSQVPLICEPKPVLNATPLINCRNNANFRPPSSGLKHQLVPPDVARLMQLEEGVRPAHGDRKKPPIPPRHVKSKEHCTVDMNGLETNV